MKNRLAKALGIAVYTTFVVFVLVFSNYSGSNRIYASDLTSHQAQAIAEVNELRTSKNLQPLNWNANLANAANDKAKDIVDNNYFDHVSPQGKKAWDFILAEKYEYKSAGENLAIDFSSVSDATEAWKESSSHYANIISPKYSDFGFAEISGQVEGRETTVYVQMFGSQMSAYERAMASSQGGQHVN